MADTPRILVTCTRCRRLHRTREFDRAHPMCPRCVLPRASARLRGRRVVARSAGG